MTEDCWSTRIAQTRIAQTASEPTLSRKLSLPAFASFVFALSACGGGGLDRASARVPLVRELEVEADYGQIYIYDPETQLADETATEDDNPLQRAMNDAYESRRFIGYDSGLIDLVTPSQFNPQRADAC